MKKAYVFPGQGAQYPGMGKELYDNYPLAKEMMNKANEILGFDILKIMFEGTEQDLMQTKVTQPAIFIHSVTLANILSDKFKPDMVAGHSLGEFSALVAAKSMTYEDGLKLVFARAMAMQKACEMQPSTMAAVIGLDESTVEEVLSNITDEIVVPANYNTIGQIVISGSMKGIELAMEKLKAAGAKRVLPLKVGGAFHSPLMEPARLELETAIDKTPFHTPICPIYQNVSALPSTDPMQIKQNLIKQLTSPVRWTQTIKNMINDGAREFIEVGPGNVLQGLIKKISSDINAYSATI
ncbi:MAG: Malonyl CoA-acyl carrier protein transacylase [Bacteroidetes bacterium ADurb.Bin035]|jgi:[acyl-carrier-protein] S-malonyltransferase|nr:ACP S-malonyltransferase [Bacteroidales bacterium]OQC45856.1 MAG: Malonyl CoA-acyl carrier protein transacylase [Bacteroidetes bacterium ADurb.Bin035]HNW20291.1 ACP S-malonyltransferase [Bacteroidales bacterium]HNY76158.1 ACP S-malonyltransferase [Bacteroidales bacterium]HOH94142.1 ACP S-malonyltransferase [Bacteroidales bacterium]